jgi:hypothetical protein
MSHKIYDLKMGNIIDNIRRYIRLTDDESELVKKLFITKSIKKEKRF